MVHIGLHDPAALAITGTDEQLGLATVNTQTDHVSMAVIARSRFITLNVQGSGRIEFRVESPLGTVVQEVCLAAES